MAGELNALSLFLPQSGNQPDDASRLATRDSAPLAVRRANLEAASLSIEHQVEDLVQISGRLPVTRDANGGLTLRDDGTYEFSALAVHRESLRIEARTTRVEVAETGAAPSGNSLTLRQVLEDVRGAFESILADLRDSLAGGRNVPQATRLTVPGPDAEAAAADPASGAALNPGTRRLLNGYLDMLYAFREQFGNNTHIDRAIASLEQFLGDGAANAPSDSPRLSVLAESTFFSFEIEVTTRTEIRVRFDSEQIREVDPIVIDLDGDGIEVSSVRDGIRFDINGDGKRNQTAFATGGDGVLVLDRNGDGVINSGRELFGDHHGAVNGFAELAKFDDNGDGRIDRNDSVFDLLRVWRDDNRDGVSQPLELLTLQSAGIQALYLANQDSTESVNGNRLAQIGAFQRLDGSEGQMADVLLNYLA